MAAADDDRRSDPSSSRHREADHTGTDATSHGDTDTLVERVSIHGIADKVKGLLRSRD